jgi:putative hemolysin
MFAKMNNSNGRDSVSVIPQLPVLMKKYLELGAQICSVPALDRTLKTIDFMVVLDRFAIKPSVYNFFKRGLPVQRDQILPSLF